MPENFKIPFVELLSKEECDLLSSRCSLTSYSNHSIIFKQNTRTSQIMFINSGLVKVYKEGRNNRCHILKLDQEGSFIGLSCLFGGVEYTNSAASIDYCEVCSIDFDVFKSIIQNNVLYTNQLMNALSKENQFLFDKLLNQIYKQLPGRIAEVLLYFSEVIYKSNSFTFPLTRKELADFAGTTKESFIRTLTEYKNDKIIEIENGKVEIISMDIIRTLNNLG